MKLVFTRHGPHRGCLKPNWNPEDRAIAWINLFLTDFIHEAPNGLSEFEVTRIVFDEFSRACVKHDTKIYANLELFFADEYLACSRELQASGKEFLTERGIARRKGKLWGLVKGRAKSGTILVSDAKLQDISHWYRDYESWTNDCYKFLISDTPLQDWIEDLLTVRNRRIDEKFLGKVGRILLNHFEHGIEVIGLNLSPDPLEDVARNLAQKLNLPLEIRETDPPEERWAIRTAK